MKKSIGLAVLLIVVFISGYLVASWRFVYSTTYILNEPLIVSSSFGDGELPKGTALHYQSMAHGEVDFYAFIRIPRDEAMAKTQEAEVDTFNGILRLTSSDK